MLDAGCGEHEVIGVAEGRRDYTQMADYRRGDRFFISGLTAAALLSD